MRTKKIQRTHSVLSFFQNKKLRESIKERYYVLNYVYKKDQPFFHVDYHINFSVGLRTKSIDHFLSLTLVSDYKVGMIIQSIQLESEQFKELNHLSFFGFNLFLYCLDSCKETISGED